MYGSIAFARWRQCAHIGGHIGATWRIRLNFLRPTRVHNPSDKSIGSVVFAQLRAESPYSLQWATLSPQNCPFLWGIRTLSNSWFFEPDQADNPNDITIGSAVFAQVTAEYPYTLHRDAPFPPQNCPFPWGDLDFHLIHGSLGPLESSTQMAFRSVQPF